MTEKNLKYARILIHPKGLVQPNFEYPLCPISTHAIEKEQYHSQKLLEMYNRLIEAVGGRGVELDTTDPLNITVSNSCYYKEGENFDKHISIEINYPNITTRPLSIKMTKAMATWLVKELITAITDDKYQNVEEIGPKQDD